MISDRSTKGPHSGRLRWRNGFVLVRSPILAFCEKRNEPFKDGTQSALYKESVRTAQ